jgi:hypothetical protein
MAIARVNQAGWAGGTAAALTVPVTYSPTAANFIAVLCVAASAQTITGVADNGAAGGSTYVAAYNVGRFAIFYTKVAAATVTTITATFGAASGGAVIVAEYSGVDATAPLDQAGAVNTGSSTAQTSGAITTLNANDLLIGFMYQTSTTADFTASGAYATMKNQDFSSQAENLGGVDQIVAATNTYTATSTTVGAVNWSAILVSFKAAAGGGGTVVPQIVNTFRQRAV